MIHFVIATGTPDAVKRVADRLSPALDGSGLYEGERVERLGASGTWAVAVNAIPDPTTRIRFAASDDAMVVVNGPAVTASDAQANVADAALRAFRSGGSTAVAETLGGTFNFVGIAPSLGLRAFSDFSGLYPLYWYQGPDFAVLSNRSTTVAAVAGNKGWDVRALAWVIGHANLFGEHMPARGVMHLPPGSEAHVAWGSDQVKVVEAPTWVWPDAADGAGRANLTDADWNEATAALVANFALLRNYEGQLRLSLTGGKDSRLCLALAIAAGLKDRLVTWTAGGPGSPEVECAAAVARAAGVPHRKPGAAPPQAANAVAAVPAQPFDADAAWRRLRQDAYRYEAIVCAWSAMAKGARNQSLNVQGFGGEFYRRGNAKQFRNKHVVDVDALAKMFVNYHQIHDPLGILQPAEADFQSQWLRAWVHDASRHVRLDVLPERFYVENRLGHWSGPLIQATPASQHINPLLSSSAARKNMELSMEARTNERFHFEVMLRAAPELVAVPFLSDTWAPEIAAGSPIELPLEPYPTALQPTKRMLTNKHQGWPLLETQSKVITSLFKRAGKHTDMGDICNMRKLRGIARDSGRLKRTGQVKEMFSSIGVALALLGETEPVVDEP